MEITAATAELAGQQSRLSSQRASAEVRHEATDCVEAERREEQRSEEPAEAERQYTHQHQRAVIAERELSACSTRMSGTTTRIPSHGSRREDDEESPAATSASAASAASPVTVTVTEVEVLTSATVEQVMKSKFMIAQARVPPGPRQHLRAAHPP